jgi:hypothetical protein
LHISDWDATVWIRTLTAGERDRFEASTVRERDGKREPDLTNLRARFAVLVLCDHEGHRIFDDRDVSALSAMSARALDLIFDVGQRLSGMTRQSQEDARKNSSPAPSGDSSSASPVG